MDIENTTPACVHFLSRKNAARHIRDNWGIPCSPQWLAKLAVYGDGPLYRKAGRAVVYAPHDLDAWAKARIGPPQRSSSDGPLLRRQ